ncbi:MAG: HAMP domain-containing histidine kinase, partial [Clostridia bacterium]|nr:HAMP domain-containing histidine kinase [Clostridia bacterium]
DRSVYSLDEQIRHVILLLESSWEEKNIQWELDLPAVEFYGNGDLVSQIWKNLFENAIKFTENNGRIAVGLINNQQGVVVTVADDGCGMEQDVLDHIFEKFYQGDVSHAKQGNGLGLSLVKRIVDLCNGTITVTSKPNKGSTFIVTLPNQLN